MVTLERGSKPEVDLALDGAVVGRIDASIGDKVASAIDRGQVFTAVIENAFPLYNEHFKPNGAILDIKVEYLLETGQPAIETEKFWRCVESSHEHRASTSFFSKVAGVTFEGRQRVVARCSIGERLTLVRDPENQFDNGAIKVLRSNGEQLGFIPSHVSRGGDPSGLAVRMDRGTRYQCRISSLTGGSGDSLGVNIEVTEGEHFDDVPSIVNTQSALRVSSAHLYFRWLFAAAIFLLLAAALILSWR